MNQSKPSAADRLRRGGPIEQPSEGRSVSGGVRVKPFRVTVDLDPSAYEELREFAHRARMSHSDVFRALVSCLDDSSVSQRVRKSVAQ